MRIALGFLFIALFSISVVGQDGPAGLVVHEWGTFTAVSGGDGTLLEWKPLIGTDLPKFVYDRTTVKATPAQRGRNQKKEIETFERMETPVLYFYPDREMEAEVSVGFPKGLITEWYPRVRDFTPELGDGSTPLSISGGSVRWGKIRLIPQDEASPRLPKEAGPNHYYAARETDSAFVRVCNTGEEYRKTEYEKFLFYRGVGNFSLPIRVEAGEKGRITVKNPANHKSDITHLFVLSIKKGGKGKFSFISRLKSGEERTVQLELVENWLEHDQLVRRIGEEMENCLVMEGLYRKEAKSMVATWTDSWFDAVGTRVFYLLPQAETEELLPLKISPAPRELKRVMVARVDLITADERAETEAIVARLGSDSFQEREEAQKTIAESRFAEALLQEVVRTTQDLEIKTRAQALLAKGLVRR